MARVAKKLTDTLIKKAKQADDGKPYRLYDGGGMHLRITAKGTKTWFLEYTHPITGKKNQLFKIGQYPEISLAQARDIRLELASLLEQGIDPKQHKEQQERERQNKLLLGDVVPRYLEHRAITNKPNTIKNDKNRIEKDVLPLLGKLYIDEITKADVRAMAEHIESRVNDDGTPPRETTRRTIDIVIGILKFAKSKDWITANALKIIQDDCKELKASYPKAKGNHFKFVEIFDLPRLLNDIENYQGVRTHLQTKLGMKFLAYTFCRTQEMRFMKWSDIDWVEKVWIVEEETLKAKHSKHRVPLSKQVIEILEQLKPITGDFEYVFYNLSKHQPYSENFVTKALKNMGYHGKQTGHGFRHIASTNLNELGYMGDAIEKQMHHKGDNTIRAIYNHAQHMEERRDIMQAWANFLDMLRNGEERASFRQARKMLDAEHLRENNQDLFDRLKAKGVNESEIAELLASFAK